MIYKSLEDVRCRSNKIALKLNEATNYGSRPLPPELADLDREWDELAAIYQNPTKYTALFKGGVEVREADYPAAHSEDGVIEGDPKLWISEMALRNKK